MAHSDNKSEYKSYVHGGLFEADDRFRAWTSNNLDKMLKQIHKVGHPIDTHFIYNGIARETYKQREDSEMRELFKKTAIEHISVFDALKPVLYNPIDSRKPSEVELSSTPAFQHLATVFTEDRVYGKAIRVCEKAIDLGLRDNTQGGYLGRIERIKKKAAKQNQEILHCDWSEIEAPNKERLIADINRGYKLCRENAFRVAKERQYDLVAISSHPTECPKCKPFQGQTFSISGKAINFTPLDNAIAKGLFHDNCHHVIHFSPAETDRFLSTLKAEYGEEARQAEITRLAEKGGWKPPDDPKERKRGFRKLLGFGWERK